MLHFYPPPTGAPKATCNNACTLAEARKEIQGAWAAFLKTKPAKAIPKAITIGKLGDALSRLNVGGMPLERCHRYVQLYLQASGPATVKRAISARPWMGGLPTDHRRCADEILACTLSLDVSRVEGYAFVGHRDYVNKHLQVFGTDAWTYIWNGNGPDYLLAGNGEFAFMESKGVAQSVTPMPPNFAEYKAQSLNAQLQLAHGAGNVAIAARHILSYAHLPAGGVGANAIPASVRWFNAAPSARSDGGANLQLGSGILTAAVALAEFDLVCSNQGIDYQRILGDGTKGDRIEYAGDIRLVTDGQMPFVLIAGSQETGPTFGIAQRCITPLLKMRNLLRSLPKSIQAADVQAFRYLRMLREAAVLSDADKAALRIRGLSLNAGAPSQMFATGLFTVTILRAA